MTAELKQANWQTGIIRGRFTGKSIGVRLAAVAVTILAAACNKSEFKGSSRTELPVVTKEFKQDAYPIKTVTHTQGHKGEADEENFEQGEWGPLDLLVVIDNSRSMIEEQQNLSGKMSSLLSHVDRSDWQIAVVTTDPKDGCQEALIKKGDPNASSKFAQAIQAGTSGDGLERGIGQAVAGLECGTGLFGLGPKWVRDDSTLAVLIVSDEDNCHKDTTGGYGCEGATDRNAAYLTDKLSQMRTVGKDARVYGLIWHPSSPSCGAALKQGDEYAQVIDATGGKWGSICDADYTSTLRQISEDVAQILKYEFELAHVPDPGTLAITVDGTAWDKYTLDGKKVAFTDVPPFGSKIDVSYRHGAEGELATAFDLEHVAVPDSFKVSVNGTAVEGFAYKESEKKIAFETAPEEKAEIKIEYKEKVELNKEFDIGTNVDPSTIVVTINGEKIGTGYSFSAETGILTFEPAPAELADIRVTFKAKTLSRR